MRELGRRGARRARRRRARGSSIASRSASHLKYEGTDTSLEVPLDDALRVADAAIAAIVAEFERRYRTRFGFLMPERPLVVEAVAVEASGAMASADEARAFVRAARAATPCP